MIVELGYFVKDEMRPRTIQQSVKNVPFSEISGHPYVVLPIIMTYFHSPPLHPTKSAFIFILPPLLLPGSHLPTPCLMAPLNCAFII